MNYCIPHIKHRFTPFAAWSTTCNGMGLVSHSMQYDTANIIFVVTEWIVQQSRATRINIVEYTQKRSVWFPLRERERDAKEDWPYSDEYRVDAATAREHRSPWPPEGRGSGRSIWAASYRTCLVGAIFKSGLLKLRSEERRVGKECLL